MGKEGEPVHSHQTCNFSLNPGDSYHAWNMYNSFLVGFVCFLPASQLLYRSCGVWGFGAFLFGLVLVWF